MIPPGLINKILAEYILPLDGIHGIAHWGRVWENGRRLADRTGAMIEVVELFALLHDARRINEGRDDGHGRRAAELIRDLWKSHLPLSDPDLELLVAACEYHTDGRTEGDITVQTCWDADRLDLFRVRIRPEPDFLCTPAAKDHPILQWAIERSARPSAPAWITQEWGIDLRRR